MTALLKVWSLLAVCATLHSLSEPDCYVSKLESGGSCKDKALCIIVEDSTQANELCDRDGVGAATYGYTRAVYAAEELQCQMSAFADEFCAGDPSLGLIVNDARLTPEQELEIAQLKSATAGATSETAAEARQLKKSGSKPSASKPSSGSGGSSSGSSSSGNSS
eukprot:Lankesteria_metandrocarpae@DN5507_c0_g1_i1.p1